MANPRREYLPWTAADVAQMTADYPADLREPLVELSRYVDEHLHGSPKGLTDLLTTDTAPDWTTVARVFQGKYDNPRRFVEDRVLPALKRARADVTGYVDLPVSRQIRECLDMWSDLGACGEICGGAGRSKSYTAYEWHLDNPYSIYIDCPAVGGVGAFLRELAKELGIGSSGTLDSLAWSIEQKLDKRNVLLVDEVARVLPASGNPHSAGVKALNFLQRLHDRQGVSVIFIATDIFDQTFQDCRLEKYLAQLHRRIRYRYQIPAVTAEEVACICRAFAPAPSRDLVKEAFRIGTGPDGIGPLFAYLRDASLLATARQEPLDLDHLAAAMVFARTGRG